MEEASWKRVALFDKHSKALLLLSNFVICSPSSLLQCRLFQRLDPEFVKEQMALILQLQTQLRNEEMALVLMKKIHQNNKEAEEVYPENPVFSKVTNVKSIKDEKKYLFFEMLKQQRN